MSEVSAIEVVKEPDLLDGWWTSNSLYALERRAVFSKTWICVLHRSRFIKPGDYVSLEVAGFPILLILGQDNIVRAFHNVCRHRAYTITKKATGSSLVLGCRYHGWSYNSKGDLLKAPHFDGVEGFNKSDNSLFKIHTCIDRSGFIHINLDAGPLRHAPDCEVLGGFAAMHGISVSSKWITGWETDRDFNWKTVEITDRTDINTFDLASPKTWLMQLLTSMFRLPPMKLENSVCQFLAPATLIVVFPHSDIWVTLLSLPFSTTRCTVKCNIYSTCPDKMLTEADLDVTRSFLTSFITTLEDKYTAMKNSPLPLDEIPILPLLKAHLKLEQLAGREIHPSKRDHKRSESFCKAEQICMELNAREKAKGEFNRRVVGRGSVLDGLDW